MKKIMVLGKTGMAGHMIYDYLTSLNKYDVVGTTRLEFDALEFTTIQMKQFFTEQKPDVVINCIGYINRGPTSNESDMIELNTNLPNTLAAIGDELKFKLIHLSSDCAFDNTPYGKSKLAGEIRKDNHLTIRTSIVGPELKENGIGLFHWFMKQSGYTNSYIDHKWNGVTTLQLAKKIKNEIVKENSQGILDYRTEEIISKHDFLKLLMQKIGKYNVMLQQTNTPVVDKTLSPEDSYDIKNVDSTTYTTQIQELRAWMIKEGDKYEQYVFERY